MLLDEPGYISYSGLSVEKSEDGRRYRGECETEPCQGCPLCGLCKLLRLACFEFEHWAKTGSQFMLKGRRLATRRRYYRIFPTERVVK